MLSLNHIYNTLSYQYPLEFLEYITDNKLNYKLLRTYLSSTINTTKQEIANSNGTISFVTKLPHSIFYDYIYGNPKNLRANTFDKEKAYSINFNFKNGELGRVYFFPKEWLVVKNNKKFYVFNREHIKYINNFVFLSNINKPIYFKHAEKDYIYDLVSVRELQNQEQITEYSFDLIGVNLETKEPIFMYKEA